VGQISPGRVLAQGGGAFRIESIDRAVKLLKSELGRVPQLAYTPPRSLSAAASSAKDAFAAVVDVVNVSAFAHKSARPGDEILVQVFLHCPDHAAMAKALAEQADPETKSRGVATLETEIAHGQKIGIVLEGPGLTIEQSLQYLTWRGQPSACQFLVSLPQEAGGRLYQIKVRVMLDSMPIGALRFTLKGATAREPVDPAAEMRGDSAKRYRQAFLSYASPDRAEVVKRAMMLLHGAHIRSTTRSLVTYEPVSGRSRTGLSLAATDIENCPPETRVPNPALRALNSPVTSTETGARRPNPRECRGFSHTQIPQRRDRTGWLPRS